MTNITIQKGNTSVTIYTVEINDNYSNELKVISFPTPLKSQEGGSPKDTKIHNYLKITHELQITGYLKTVTDRDNLIYIFKGAGTKNNALLYYANYPVYPMSVTCEKLTINHTAVQISPEYKYQVQLTLIEGI